MHFIIGFFILAVIVGAITSKDRIGKVVRRGILILAIIIGSGFLIDYYFYKPQRETEKLRQWHIDFNQKMVDSGKYTIGEDGALAPVKGSDTLNKVE